MRFLTSLVAAISVFLVLVLAHGQGIYICQGPNCPPSLNGITLSNATFNSGAPTGTVVGNLAVITSGPPFTGSYAAPGGPNGSSFQVLNGNQLATNGIVSAAGSTQNYNIMMTANQATAVNTTITVPITVTAQQVPTAIAFTPPSPVSVFDNITASTAISAISVTASDGHAFFGTLSLTANAGGRVALSGSNIVPAHNFTSADDGSNLTVMVQATENGTNITGNLTLNVTAPLGTCPMGSADPNDGCTAANANSGLQHANFFTGFMGTTYAVRPPWNVAAVDYPVGYDTTLTLKDPATLSGCASFGTNAVTVSSAPCTINGYDFSLHNGACLDVTAASGTVTITNNKFAAGTGCNRNGGYLINLGGNSTKIFEYNRYDDLVSTGTSCASNLAQFQGIIHAISGPVTIEYNAIMHSDEHEILSDGGSTTVRYNWMGNAAAPCHGDYVYLNSSSTLFDDSYNTQTAIADSNGCCFATAFCYFAGNAGTVNTTVNCNNNVLAAGAGLFLTPNRAVDVNWQSGSPTITNFNLNNNFVDPTGINVGFLVVEPSGTVTNSTCSGNINMVNNTRYTGTTSGGNATITCN